MKFKVFLMAIAVGFTSIAFPAGVRAESDVTPVSVSVGEGIIPGGVTIGGSDVSGLNRFQAEAALNDMLRMYDDTHFVLNAEGGTIEATGADIKIKPLNTDIIDSAINYGKRGNIIERFMANSDIAAGKAKSFDLSLACDWQATKAFLEEHAPSLASAPVDHSIIRESGGFRFIEGKTGLAVNTDESANVISEYITTQWDGTDASIDLIVELREPKGSKEQLMAVKDLLGSCNTDFSTSSSNRAANVRNGASKLNQSVIYPGETFSVSTNLGSRNAENGYLPAPSYENGITVDTYGGGVCQISTTLYNAVIRAELEIVERSPHSMVVSYVKPSMDAAISEGSKDFIFRNNKEYPVYIEGYTSGGLLYFNVFGKEDRPSNRKVTYESEVLSTTEPPDKFVADSSLPVGTVQRKQSAHTGYSARLWKVVTVDGVEESRKVFNNSSYRASSAIYAVGTASDNEQARAAINDAIASQNKETITNVAQSWTPEGMAQQENNENTEDINPLIPQEPLVPNTTPTVPDTPLVPDTPTVPPETNDSLIPYIPDNPYDEDGE